MVKDLRNSVKQADAHKEWLLVEVIDVIDTLLYDEYLHVSDWEHGFLENLKVYVLKNNKVSDAQLEKLNDIKRKHYES